MAVDSIKIIKIEPCENPQYIKPRLITYIQSGIEKTWEIANTHDSVSILLSFPQISKSVLKLPLKHRTSSFVHRMQV